MISRYERVGRKRGEEIRGLGSEAQEMRLRSSDAGHEIGLGGGYEVLYVTALPCVLAFFRLCTPHSHNSVLLSTLSLQG